MATTKILLIVLAAVAVVSPADGLPGWTTLQRLRRALLQTPPPLFDPPAVLQTSGTTAQCAYYSSVPMNNGLCVLAPEFLLSIVAPPPDSYIANALTAVHARRRHCSSQRNTTCYSYQASHGCYWAASAGAPIPSNKIAAGASCLAADYDSWISFRNNPMLSQAPLWAWCPNTDAWRYMRCSARTAASAATCAAVSGCTWDSAGRTCRPAFLMAKDAQQRQDWLDNEFSSLTPSAAGSCEGACWLRELMAESGGTAGQPFTNVLGTSNWGSFMERKQAECRNEGFLDAADCAGTGFPSTGVLTSRMEAYSKWGPLSGAAGGVC